jgi:hypothetical protein
MDDGTGLLRSIWAIMISGEEGGVHGHVLRDWIPEGMDTPFWLSAEAMEAVLESLQAAGRVDESIDIAFSKLESDWGRVTPEARSALESLAARTQHTRLARIAVTNARDARALSVPWATAEVLFAPLRSQRFDVARARGMDLERQTMGPGTHALGDNLKWCLDALPKLVRERIQWDLAAIVAFAPGERARLEYRVRRHAVDVQIDLQDRLRATLESMRGGDRTAPPKDLQIHLHLRPISAAMNDVLAKIEALHPTPAQIRDIKKLAPVALPTPASGKLAPSAAAQSHAIVLIHGIRTQAEWQQRVKNVLERDPAIRVVPVRYEFFDVVRFILPIPFLRQKAVDRVEQGIRDVKNIPGVQRTSLLCHSFGTWIVARLLQTQSDMIFHRIALCGSIVCDDFDWGKYRAQYGEAGSNAIFVVNDCAMSDIWPVLAKSITWGYGSSGRFGFAGARVLDRFHRGGHSSFFTQQFVEDYWLPFFSKGVASGGEMDRPTTSWWISLLTLIRLKYLLIAGIVLAVWSHFGVS